MYTSFNRIFARERNALCFSIHVQLVRQPNRVDVIRSGEKARDASDGRPTYLLRHTWNIKQTRVSFRYWSLNCAHSCSPRHPLEQTICTTPVATATSLTGASPMGSRPLNLGGIDFQALEPIYVPALSLSSDYIVFSRLTGHCMTIPRDLVGLDCICGFRLFFFFALSSLLLAFSNRAVLAHDKHCRGFA